MSAGYITIYEV